MKKKRTLKAVLSRVWSTMISNKQLLVGVFLVVILGLLALLAPVLAPYDPYVLTPEIMKPPGTPGSNGAPAHLLGTDKLGRDVLSQLL